jgi:ATP-dependent helicase/DNAse subunit B
LEGLFGPQLLTFQDFVEEIIRVNDSQARFLDDVQRRLLAEQLVARLSARGELSYFQGVVDTGGFGEDVFQFLAELKRNGAKPEELSAAAANLPESEPGFHKARQAAHLYADYQAHLIRLNLYDMEGRFWHARDLLAQCKRKPFEKIRLVLVDGFVDFTGMQREILTLLAHGLDELWISVPDEPGDERVEMQSRARATRQYFERLNPQVDWLGEPDSLAERPAGLRHIERQLFRALRRVEQTEDAAGIVAIEAPGLVGECRLVAREIKTLLQAGIPADDIVVTLRDLTPYVDLIDEVFTEYGIAIDMEGGEPLARNPAVATLLRAFRLREEDWPFAGLTALLRSNYFQPEWPELEGRPDLPQQAEALLRLLAEPGGQNAYLQAIQHWADTPPKSLEDEQAEASRRLKKQEFARLCRPFFGRLFAAWNVLPPEGPLSAYGDCLARFAAEVGIERAAQANPLDSLALEHLWKAWKQWLALETRWPGATKPREFSYVLRLLGVLARTAVPPRTARGPGRVRILSAPLVRDWTVPYLFVMGLGERSFPQLNAPEPFFNEAERQSFRQSGLNFSSMADALPDEMLLFYQVVTRARRQLVLSYPAVDDKGQNLLPCSFLTILFHCFKPDVIPTRRQRMLIEGFDRNEPFCPAETRVAAARAHREGSPAALKELASDLAANLASAARMAQRRFRDKDYNLYDGLLGHPEALRALQSRFGPERIYSPTALEEYIACPFKFFLKHVVKLAPLDEPADEIESTQRGQAFHRALSRLHIQLQKDGVHHPHEHLNEQLQGRLDEAVQEYVERSHPASKVLWNLEGQRLSKLALRYQQHWIKFLTPWNSQNIVPRPYFFEHAFGMPPEEGGAEPLVIEAEGIEVRLRGRIDRVDVAELETGLGFWVIDYKTGKPEYYTSNKLLTFERLQLLLYALAVERVLLPGQDARPLGLAYWLVADKGPKVVQPKQLTSWFEDSHLWPAVREELEKWVATLVRQIRSGSFPLHPRSETCTETCDFGQVCRISQSRSLNKHWDLPLPNEVEC